MKKALFLRRFFCREAAKAVKLKAPTPVRKEEQLQQLVELSRRMEGEIQPDSTVLSMQSLKPSDALRLIDSSFEAFFRQRSFSTQNFNRLLQIHAAKRNYAEALATFERMPYYRVRPSVASFALMVTCASKTGDIALAEEYFDRGVARFGRSVFLSSALLQAYSRTHDGPQAEKAEALFAQDLLHGLKPDTAVLTSLINCLRKAGLTRKCWDYFERRAELKVAPDDVLYGLMIRLCGVTADAEKAKLLFKQMSAEGGVRLTCLHYNGLIAALASREEYAPEAIELFAQMVESSVQPDSDTFVAVLAACGRARNLAQAFNALTLLRQFRVPPNKYIVAKSLEVYARVLAAPNLPRECRAAYLADAWRVFEGFARSQARFVNAPVLNALLDAHACSESLVEAEELVLPLFERHGVRRDRGTYLVFFKGFAREGQPVKARQLYHLVKAEPSALCWQALNIVGDCALKLADFTLLDEVLDQFLRGRPPPSRALIRRVASVDCLPDSLHCRLRRFPFGEYLLGGRPRTARGYTPPAQDAAEAVLHEWAEKAQRGEPSQR